MANRSEKSFSGSLLDKVTAHLKKVLSSVTNSSVQSIDANAPIEVFGVRAILQMTNQLEKSLGWLSKTLYFEYPNLAAMAQYFVESHSEKLTCLLGSNAGQENSNASCHVSRDNGPSLATSRESELRQQDKGENIAIIGLSCRFPQARNMHEFWDNLRNGRDCIEEIPGNRWNYRLYFDEERNKLGKTYGKWGGFVEGFDQFDPTFFNITPREAEMMDPQERVFLQCVYSAVEDAGYTPRTLNRNGATGIEQPVGVYVGLMFEEYNLFRGDILGSPASIANRISYFCNFRGPSIAVDTMCSSSLTAIHLACQSLKRGECGSAIAGGVNLTLHPNKYLMLARLKMASPKGQCKAFGENSDGYVPGEGVGAVVLKTLPDALADGDHIYGVIQATAINQSGKTRSYFAPSPNAQAELIEQACKTAGISPRIVTCIEAHGTGTSLGDPIEVAGLTKAFRKHTADKQYCAIGSVKSNVGHCEGAAGIAGLTKVLLQMKHAQLVPSLHSEHPNTNINFGETPFAVQHKLEEWKRPQLEVDGSLREYPRIAGISSFGAGGANAHVVVEEYIAEERKGRREGTAAILLSAKTEEQLRKQATQLLEAIELQRLGPEDLWDMAYTLQVGREGMEHRLGLTAETIGEVAEKLKKYAQGEQEIEELYSGEVKKNRDMAAAFSGDEDLVAALENWLRKGKWAKLLDLWTKGVEIDWSQIYLEGEKPRRVSLPTYPFAGERHWVEPFEEKGARKEAADRGRVLHPLVQTNSSRVGEQRYTSQFSGEEFFLAEHRVGGNRMLPGVAYLEMARAAIEQSWPGRPESTFLELRNTVWAQPIIVSETKQISISLLVNDDEQIDFEIFSQDGDQEIVHCHGQAVWSDAPVPAKLDLSQRKQQLGQGRLEPSTIYAGFARVGLVHGPSLQAITAVHRASGQALAHLCLPRAVEETWEDFVLHPSLMDGALQATAGVIDDGSNLFKQTRLPFALESLRIIAPCTREMVAWVRNAPGSQAGDQVIKLDIDLCDESGNVCVQMKGFSSRELKNGESKSPIPLQEIQPGLYSFVPVWNPARSVGYPKVILPGSQRVLLLGADLTHLDWVQQSHPNACLLQLSTASTIDVIQTKLKDCSFDHLIWIAPDVATSGDRSKEENDDQIIEHQEFGVLAVFRIVKALLRLGYADKELRWTIITGKTQQVKKTERIQPTHAAIFGLVGSLAKEYPHWNLSLLDVESLESVTAGECLSMPADKRGNGLACRQGEWFSQEFVHVPFQPPLAPVHYRQNGVYVVIGGAGGLGEVWSRFMIENYQASVVWIGRREYNATIEAKINSLTRPGKAPLYISADATKLDSLQRAFERILESYPAIHGVVHSALVLQDQSLAQMEESKFRTSLSAKVDISVNLERVFGRQKLDFMLFFSSIMSFIKAPGQANYAAGCTFKDSFAQKIREQRAYPVKIMNWGYWGRVGIVAGESYNKAMESKGIGSIEPQEGMKILQTFLSSELSQMGFIKTIDALSLHDLDLSQELTYYSQGSVAKFPEVQQNLIQEAAANKLECLKETAKITVLDPLLAELLASSLMSLGLFQQGIHRFSDLRLGKQPPPFYERWLSSSIYYLQQRELLGQDFTVSPAVRALGDLWPAWEAKKSEWSANPDLQAQIVLLEACLKALPTILSGKRLATDVMFPDSSMRLVEGIYRGNRVADYFNEVLGDTLSAWVDHQLHWNKERSLRILEIGAGTGGTTIKLLPLLQRLPVDEYCYTDLSKAFLMHAEEQYQPHFPALTTAIFDVSKPLAMQSIEPDHYDVVIATNVLHATPSIRETLRNAKAALKNQGILLLNEIGSWSLFTHLTFGLLEGWWLHEDTALRLPGSPGLAPGKWHEILTEEGFESIFFPAQQAHEFGQQIIAACSNGWVRQPLTQQPELKPVMALEQEPSTPAIIIPAAPMKSSSRVEETLREKSLSYFQNLVASTLKMRPDQIEPRRSFAEYGLDSILIGQLTYRLRQIFSDIAGTLFFEVQSINGLVDYFLENKKQELAAVLSITDTAPQTLPVASVSSTASLPQSTSKKRRSSRSSASVVAPEQQISPELPAGEQPALMTTPGTTALLQHIFDVAIIGLSGRYPRSNSLKELWINLSKGVNCITEIPRDRWDWEKYFDPEKGKAGKIYTKWGGFIDGIDQFDPLFFKISPKEAKRMDPQERLFLEACYHAIEDAGYTPENLGKPEKIGVFVGVMNSRYTPQPAHASIANRVSYLFNFQGPSMAVDTACSSSLTAIHVALESIYSGLSACAIAGGVNLIIDPVHYVTLAEMTMLSSGNQCKAFGEQADGLVDAEGVGAVVLKPLQQAQLDGDHIYAVIKGSAINAGGRTHGYTVPNPQAQAKLVSLALERAKVTAEQVSYVEAHGTGTALGDPIEIAGLTKAFKETSEKQQFCSIGSLKSNIGHCESAAGIAGLTKVLLQLKYEQLAPSLHSDIPNPEIDFGQTPFKVQKSLEKWERPLHEVNGVMQEIPRIAGISSFGAGGSNAHVIVQEYQAPEVSKRVAHVENAKSIIVLSARNMAQLKQKACDLLAYIREEKESVISSGRTIDLASVAYTLQVGRESMEERLGLVVSSVEQLVEKLQAYVADRPGIEDLYQGQVKHDKEALSLFNTDSDLQQTIDKWITNQKLSKLLDLWVKGLELDWNKLYGESKPQRISLPAYPFARERYWIETAVSEHADKGATTAVLHPLLHSNTSDLSQQCYSSTFTGEEFFLKDYQVDGQKTLPVAAHLEMARVAVEKAANRSPETALELRNVVWAQPVIVTHNKQIGIALLANEAGQIDYEIYSQEADEEVIHCQGSAIWNNAITPAKLDLEQLKRQMEQGYLEPGSVYARCARIGLVYGPALQGIKALYQGSNQLLAQLELPKTVENTSSEYLLHPSLIDSALQAAIGLIDGGSERLPFAVESLRIVSRCPPEMFAWVRYAPANEAEDKVIRLDIDLCDKSGNIVTQMRGASWQQASLNVVEPVVETAAPMVPNETTFAPRARKEIILTADKPPAPVPVEKKKRAAISLAAPGIASAMAVVSSERPAIKLSNALLGRFEESAEAAVSSVRLFDDGNSIFSIQITDSNAQTKDVIAHLLQALERVQQEVSVKVVLFRGLEHLERGGREDYNQAVTQRFYLTLVTFPSPVIAVLQGDAEGAAMLAAALCDFMVCNEDASYGYTDPSRHFYPTTKEALLFSERFGAVQAQEFLYGSTTATGKQLQAKGWTCPIVSGAQVETFAEQLASTLAAKSPEALRLLKQNLTRHLAGVVQELSCIEFSETQDRADSAKVEQLASPAEHIHLDRPAEDVLVIKFGVGNQKLERKELAADLGRVFAEVRQSVCKAIVLASEYPSFLPEMESTVAEAEDFQHLLMESEIPVIAALEGDAKGAGWLISQYCDACVYNRTGTYSFPSNQQSQAVAQNAAALFAYRMSDAVGQEIVLTGAEYSGINLQQRVGALRVAKHDEVLATAIQVAASWAKFPRAILADWKKQGAMTLREKIRTLPAWEEKDEAPGPPPATSTPVPLKSKVVSATAHPEGIVVVKMEDRQAKNMFSEAFLEGVTEVLAHIEQTPIYKVVILTGYDRYFASGGTKENLLAIQEGKAKFTDSKVFQAALDCKLPVIAAMQGHAIGGGWSLGMFADLVLLSEESQYVSPYINYGFTPGAGATYILAEKIGNDLARESLLTGQQYAGRELKDRGVRLPILLRAEVTAAAMALARQIAQSSRSRLMALKQQWTKDVKQRLEETYRLELAMHEKTFVGRSETLVQIQKNFYQEQENETSVASTQPACVEAENASLANDVLQEVKAALKTLLANELQMRESDLDEHVQFVDMGLDSISGVTWIRKINEKYQTSIEATKVYSHPTLNQLSSYVREEAGKQGTLSSTVTTPVVEARAKTEKGSSLQRELTAKFSTNKLTSWRSRKAARFANLVAAPAIQPMAVIGMAGQFPQAKNLEEFWQNLAQGKNCITKVPAERWDVDAYYQRGEIVPGKTNCPWGGALEEYDRFDPLFFNISPTEAESMDPQQRLFLQACWHSIENAGYDPRVLSGSKCGVFAGCGYGDYHLLSREQQISAQGFTGDATSILAARISYFLNLQGPCISIDTACSASLVAIAQACDSLISGNSDLALAGGVYVMAGPELHIKTAQAGMLSPEGKCFTFDQRADGFVPGEGVGVVLLKRLSDAQRDHDMIYGVIQGWGVNQDGKTNGITAPNPESQTRLEQEVYDKYQIDPASIQLIEAHGTGTKLGDPIEVEGLKKAFQKYTQKREYCALGSVKSNIGHCATAAGVAGVIKLLLALQHKQLPPTINFEQLNEHINLNASPFYVNSRLQEWKLEGGQRRQAAISSFGFSGTNAHMVIAEHQSPVEVQAPAAVITQEGKVIIPLSARTAAQLKQKACDLWDYLRREGTTVDLIELAYTLQVGREAMEERMGFLVSSVGQLGEKLEAYIEGRTEIKDIYQGQGKRGKENISIVSQDEEMRETVVGKWIAQKKLAKLLDLWVKGLELDWSKLYGEAKPRRIRLPLYPFAKERYWIEATGSKQRATGAASTAVLHPLLHSNTSDLSEQRYSSTFTGEEFFLADHQVAAHGHGIQKVLPGVAYLEMARAAIEQASPTQPESSILELRNTVWLKPVVVANHKQVSMAVFASDGDHVSYEIYSIEAEQKTVHCQGEAIFKSHSALARLDIEQLKAQMERHQLEASHIYEMFANMGLNYGPAHRGITTIYVGEKQLLTQLRLPAVVETDHHEYVLHPSLMDSALQASIGLVADLNHAPNKPSVPFVLESVRIISPCTKEMVAWVRYSKGSEPEDKVIKLDIDLCDQQGNICVQMHGFSSRVLEGEIKPSQPKTISHPAYGTPDLIEDRPVFDSAFYQKLIADIVNHEVSVDQAVELG